MNHDDWNWKEINKKQWKILGGEFTIRIWHSKIPGRKTYVSVGVDPGRNFGICTLDGREAWAFSGTLPKEDSKKKYRYGIASYNLMKDTTFYHGKGPACVEGAAYKEPYGQSDLAYIRMGFFLGLHSAGFDVSMAPPSTIRLNALGKGNIGGLQVWPELNHNASDAVAVALYAAGLRKEEVSGSYLGT